MHLDPRFSDYTDLATRNSMALCCHAQHYVEIITPEQILPLFTRLAHEQQPYVVLSGGSNIILPPRLDAWVVVPALKGIYVRQEQANSIDIAVMAGENWHQFVTYSVKNGWYGLENLALIPGWVGASPVQNIGAYGVQIEDYLLEVEAFHIPTLQWHTLSQADCQLTYRDSLFKQQAGQWLISKVTFRLTKNPISKMHYGDLALVATEIAHRNQHLTPTPHDIMDAVIQLRQSKLPDPKVLANCGSFFKNPVVPKMVADDLLAKFPKIVQYPTTDPSLIKLAAGWLIDTAGLKGGGVMPILTHTQQALVLTNHAPQLATQADILQAIQFIQQHVLTQFGVLLEPEPVWIEQDGHIGTPA